MLIKIYRELLRIRKELQAIRSSMESVSEITIPGNVNANKLKGIISG